MSVVPKAGVYGIKNTTRPFWSSWSYKVSMRATWGSVGDIGQVSPAAAASPTLCTLPQAERSPSWRIERTFLGKNRLPNHTPSRCYQINCNSYQNEGWAAVPWWVIGDPAHPHSRAQSEGDICKGKEMPSFPWVEAPPLSSSYFISSRALSPHQRTLVTSAQPCSSTRSTHSQGARKFVHFFCEAYPKAHFVEQL